MDDKEVRAHHTIISSLVDDPVKQNGRELKVKGFSVRCTKIE
jgi:hypothetical protein